MRIDNDALGLTLEQVRTLSESAWKPGTAYGPGDHVTWMCSKCTYKAEFVATESGYMNTWPDELVEHIWRAGHYDITSDTGRPIPAYCAPRATPWERRALIVLAGAVIGFILASVLMKILN